jgi:hypothetical protein
VGTEVVGHGGGVGGHVCGFGVDADLHLQCLWGLPGLHLPAPARSSSAAAIKMKTKTIPLVPKKAMAGGFCCNCRIVVRRVMSDLLEN